MAISPVNQSESVTPIGGIPDGITRDDVLDALQRLDAGVEHAFAASMKYDVVYKGLRYAPKAVIGLAAERLSGRQLGPYDFKGGEESKCFRVLEGLGFTITEKETAAQPGVVGKPWRTDPVLAGQRVNDILGNISAETRLVCLNALQACISLAEAHASDRWLLTLHLTHVRFIAGMVMCLQYTKRGTATLLLLKSQTPVKLRRNAGTYKHAPGCLEVHLSINEFAERYAGLQSAHQSGIRVCLEKRATAGGHRRAHAPGLVTYLASLSSLDVPLFLSDEDPAEIAAIQRLCARTDIGPTTKRALVDARRGHGVARQSG